VDEQPLLLGDLEAQLKVALEHDLLSNAEAKLLRAAHAARRDVIAVDDFKKI